MRKFTQYSPKTLEEAVALLREHPKAKAYAGGTDVMGGQKSNIYPEYPEALISLKHIEGMDGIALCGDHFEIGAFATLDAVSKHPEVKAHLPLFAQAAKDVASPQIRHAATVAGNLSQEPRCWYYRYPNNGFHCLRKGGRLCSATTGNNLYHSIFGGMKVCKSACESRCPNNTPIPAYAELLRKGDYDGAARLLWLTHPLAPVTGRVCPHNCQSDCARAEFNSSVSIRCMERAVGDHMLAHAAELLPECKPDTGKKVAIIGAGPAGLVAAYYLRLMGHGVTVFDRNDHIGGMLYYGIPAYRLEKSVLARMQEIFEGLGIVFRLGVKAGEDVLVSDLTREYDGVLAAPGAQLSRKAGVPGEELAVGGIDFLREAAEKNASVPGKTVVVVGGGSVAMDVAVTAKRLGAEQVTAVCLEPADRMPAAEEELHDAIEEGIAILNGYGPMEVITEDGKVTGLKVKSCPSVWDEDGRFAPTYDESNTRMLPCDGVYMAIGQRADLDFLADTDVIRMGDAATGPKTAVDAIKSAKEAVAMLCETIGGSLPEVPEQNRTGQTLSFDPACLEDSHGISAKKLAPAERTLYGVDTTSPALADAAKEASRCYNCGCLAVTPSDLGSALCALGGSIVTTCRTLSAEEFFTAGVETSTVLCHDELIEKVIVPLPANGTVQSYQKYRARKSVDFPLVALSAVLPVQDGVITDARLVLGAAAPTPLRLTHVEALLNGKAPTEELSREAAALVRSEALPLKGNGYKVRIAAALVRRAIAELLK